MKLEADALVVEHSASRRIVSGFVPQNCEMLDKNRVDDKSTSHRELWRGPRKVRLVQGAATEVPQLFEALRSLAMTEVEDTSLTVQVHRQGQHGLSFVTERIINDEVDNQLACVWLDGVATHCVKTHYGSVNVVDAEHSLPRGWLLAVDAGVDRSKDLRFVWLDVGAHVAELPVDVAEGYGESCVELGQPGYCVWMSGVCSAFKLHSTECIEIGPSIGWSAVHVRMKERWIDAKSEPIEEGKAPAPGTYHPTADGWVLGECSAGRP